MPENEQQDKTLSEILVKEAVGKGMDSPMRDSILEAVEEADGSTPGGKRSLPLAGVLFGAGAVLGFLAGRESPDLEETPLEDVQEPDIIEDVIEETTSDDAETTEMESESETADDGGSSRLSRVLLAVGLLAGVAVLRRRLSGGEEEEWEPIEEFEPATGDEFDADEDEDDESEAEEAEAEAGESDETEEE
ncbi:hypothetical protein [Natronorubrum halophilum]|uniref:hypothetical protein n=1 Tax=Natronorubrum halophilum TaxID=1702106 RepID=UPI000EF6B3D8|nr:hypothetical protein [Natronorubrum halophilum]